jgi:hypothetical protein
MKINPLILIKNLLFCVFVELRRKEVFLDTSEHAENLFHCIEK